MTKKAATNAAENVKVGPLLFLSHDDFHCFDSDILLSQIIFSCLSVFGFPLAGKSEGERSSSQSGQPQREEGDGLERVVLDAVRQVRAEADEAASEAQRRHDKPRLLTVDNSRC